MSGTQLLVPPPPKLTPGQPLMIELQGLSVPLIFILSLISFILSRERQRKRAPYPPGPTPKPIIGNALDIPLEKPWKKYMEWSKQFNSGIIHLSTLNTHIVVLNTMEDIVELLEKRSTNYSDRPLLKIFDLMGVSGMTGFLPYGPTLKTHRRLMDEALKKDVLPSYHHIFSEKVHFLLDQLLHKPDLFREHIGELGASVTMAIAFGYDVASGVQDRLVEPAEFALNTGGGLVIPGRTILVVFGFLCYIPPWIPGASTQRLCAEVKEAVMFTREGPYQYVKNRTADAGSNDCVLARALERDSGDLGFVEDKELLKDIMASFYFGGVDTMKASMANFMLAMTLHTHAQRKAQDEVDSVVGSHRLPSYEDRASLPYVEALYREVHRWRPIVPTGLSHATIRDDVYKGYYIPKGTIVLPNICDVNEDKYPDPHSLNPDRFLNLDGTLNDDTVSYGFGLGRRICPGRYMADKVVWLMMVTVLATFNFSKAHDGETGNEIDIDPDAYTDGVTSHPLPFKCSINRRSEQAESLIRNASEVA